MSNLHLPKTERKEQAPPLPQGQPAQCLGPGQRPIAISLFQLRPLVPNRVDAGDIPHNWQHRSAKMAPYRCPCSIAKVIAR